VSTREQRRDDAAIDTPGGFLVHALELKHDAAEHYAQLADSMEVHHNPRAATLFRVLAAASDALARSIAAHAKGMTLPRIAPWEMRWNGRGGPESDDCAGNEVSYRMTAAQAIGLALHNEQRAQQFFAAVALHAGNARVRRLAAEMRDKEAEHVAMLEQMLAQQQAEPGHMVADDLDPPHMPA
jgi:hypothetical protein